MALFEGYLFSKLMNIGSKSQGPQYYLQEKDYSETIVNKKCQPWQIDKQLHKNLDSWVSIDGKLYDNKIEYNNITQAQQTKSAIVEPVNLTVHTPANIIWVNKQPSIGQRVSTSVKITSTITNTIDIPLYDSYGTPIPIEIEIYDSLDKKIFTYPQDTIQLVTNFYLPPKASVDFIAYWSIEADLFESECTCTIVSKYLPRKLEDKTSVDIKFAW